MKPTERDIARFMRYVDKLPCGCWYWTGARSRGRGNRKWYGTFHCQGQSIRAHRFSHDYLGGKHCPPGYHRDHTCEFSMCVNFEHLDAVPPEVNQERKEKRKRKEPVPMHDGHLLASMFNSALGSDMQ